MRYRLVVFDLDGTILYTLQDLADSVNYSLQKKGFPSRTIEEVRNFVGNGIRKLIERAVPPGTEDDVIEEIFQTFTEHYKSHCADNTKPYDGIIDLLRELRENGIITAVVSNKADYGVQKLCAKYFPGLFDFVVGEREGIRRKPCPDSLLAVVEKFGVELKETVYVGDSDVDLQTAANAGVDIIPVGWGFRDEQFLRKNGAKFVIHRPDEVFKYIQ